MKDWPTHKANCKRQTREQTKTENCEGTSGCCETSSKENRTKYEDNLHDVPVHKRILKQGTGTEDDAKYLHNGAFVDNCKGEPVLGKRPSSVELQRNPVGLFCCEEGINNPRTTDILSMETTAKEGGIYPIMKQEDIPCDYEATGDADSLDTISVYVKHNKLKHKLKLSLSSADTVFQMISDYLCIPLSKLKLIHKGKMVREYNVKEFLYDKTLFLAFGEVAESEEGLEKGDVDVIVNQLAVERNVAIRALRKTGSVIDAILEIGNR